MTCTCPKPSLHDRVLRAISIRNAEEYSDMVTAAARLLVSAHESDVAEGIVSVDDEEADEYRLLIADIDNETCGRSMGQESLAEDLEKLLLRLLAFIAGARDDERKLHVRLAAHRIRGEWFHPHQDVLDAFRIS